MPLLRRGPGLIRGATRTAVIAGTATAVSGRVQRRQQERWVLQDYERYQQQAAAEPAAAAPAAPTAGGDLTAQLRQLAQLHDSGPSRMLSSTPPRPSGSVDPRA
jgi:hypothetical protein